MSDALDKFLAKLRGIWTSWTIWANGVGLTVLGLLPVLQETVPQLESYLPANAYKWAMLIVLVGNIALRFRTNRDLASK